MTTAKPIPLRTRAKRRANHFGITQLLCMTKRKSFRIIQYGRLLPEGYHVIATIEPDPAFERKANARIRRALADMRCLAC